MLTARQELLLRKVVEGHAESGQPVGSKALAADPEITHSPSTIRNELAVLEELGLLAHPHTSAGRIPTERGYRYFVDRLLPTEVLPASASRFELQLVRREIDEAMRITAETLSQVTNLLAIVSAPPIRTATVRHVELLALQPQVLMVVVITSTGGVTKRLFTFDAALDPGLVDWAAAYLNERLAGVGLGARRLVARLDDEGLSPTERAFLRTVAPAFTDLAEDGDDGVYVDGASRLLAAGRVGEHARPDELLELLERRRSLLEVLASALGRQEVYVRIGAENEAPALQSMALVAANYGLPRRNLGTVSVIGPLAMDYATAIRSVRDAAQHLSRFVADVYDG